MIKVYRENYGLTTAELAKELGELAPEEIFEMEYNKRDVNFEIAEKLSQFFEIPIEKFLNNNQEEQTIAKRHDL